ncbi:MAG TPA: VWA domain-containing protein [Thermoanaerobaculia bacterium]|nr:VWA domain-containing protein [Thermoanaerobaculia bacterium]
MNAQRWLAVVAVVLVSAGALAQRVAETVQVTVIEVPVTVTGGDGKPLRGLTREQFELFDDGKRVPVEYFEVLDLKLIPAGRKSLPPAATRNFLLFFDLANSSPGTIRRAADAAVTFIDEQLEPHDLAAVATFTAETGAKLITSFTTDREMLRAAVRTLGHPQYFKVSDPLMISFRATEIPIEPILSAGTSSTDRLVSGVRSAAQGAFDATINEEMRDAEQERNRMTQSVENTEQRNRLRVQLSEMATIARVLDRLHGRKQIILLSEGFDARLVQGREDIGSKKVSEESEAAFAGQVWKLDSDEKYGNASAARDIREMAELFRRSDVVLHAIDIKGLRASNADAAAHELGRGKSNEALFLITRPTGGTVFQNANDLEATFARMLEQQEVVYLLGFRGKSTNRREKFHSLKVKTSVAGARVSHRAGYYEPSALSTNLEKTISLTEILMTDKPVNDVGMSVAITALPGAFVEKARVPLVVELPGKTFVEGVSDLLTANLFIYAFDEKNQVKDHLAQRIALDITDDVEAVRAGGIRYFGTLHLPPGAYAIKAIVRVEESGRIGFVRSDVRVPQFESAAVMPPLFLAPPGNFVMLSGSPRGDSYAYPFAVGEEKYVPRSRPVLAPDTPHRLALFLHRMPVENLGVTPVLASASGETQPANVRLIGRTAPDAQGSVKLMFDFTPEGLRSGDYELRFTVKPNQGTESVVTVPFRIL